MKKSIRLVLVCILCFFSMLCFADTSTILFDNREITVPNYDEFKLTTDKNSPEYKKIEELFQADKNSVPYGFYYEPNPRNPVRLITILGFSNIPQYITKNEWDKAKNDIYEDSQAPITRNQDNVKSVQTLTESITNHDLYNTYITETKVYLNENNKLRQVVSMLDAKTYIYLHGKIIVLMITIEGANGYNVSTLDWAKNISQATAEKVIELNPPTEKELAAEKAAERTHKYDQIKYFLLIVIGLLALLWKYRFKYLPQSLHHYFSPPKDQDAAIQKQPK